MFRKIRSTKIRQADLPLASTSQIEQLETRLLFSTYTVTTTGDGAGVVTSPGPGKFNASTLRAAITAANAHAGADTINFAAAVVGTINLGSALPAISDTLTLAGPGTLKLTVERSANATTDFSIFYLDTGTTANISGLAIAKGTGTLFTDADGNTFVHGGGIVNNGVLTVNDCTIAGNSAVDYGGGIANEGKLTLTRCTLSGNSVGQWGRGGGIQNDPGASLTLNKCALSDNQADNGGGGISNNGTASLSACTLTDNSYGGISNFSGVLFLTGCSLSNNEGAIDIWDGTVTLNACAITGNSTTVIGGGIFMNGGSLSLTGCILSGNSDNDGSGGAIDNANGTLTLTNCTLSSNSATGSIGNSIGGGGIYNDGTLILTDCTLSANSASASNGGAIYNDLNASMRITACALTGNSVIGGGNGGGIYNQGTAALSDCTFAGNSTGVGDGGGIYNDKSAALAITQCTVSANVAVAGGGIYNRNTTTLLNSVVAANRDSLGAADDIAGAVNPISAFNLIGTGRSGGLVNGKNGNKVGISASALKLASLADNGGPTQTMALLPGSLAIDAGSDTLALGPDGKPLATDQRGFSRIVNGRADIGAFEVQRAPQALGFALLDALSGKSLGTLTDGTTISLSKLGTKHLDVQALASAWAGSVTFSLNGKYVGTDSLPLPFTLLGAENQAPAGGLVPSDYTLIVQSFTVKYARGMAGSFKTVHFKVVA